MKKSNQCHSHSERSEESLILLAFVACIYLVSCASHGAGSHQEQAKPMPESPTVIAMAPEEPLSNANECLVGLWAGQKFTGATETLMAATKDYIEYPDLTMLKSDLGGEIGSIAAGKCARVEVFSAPNFRGESMTFEADQTSGSLVQDIGSLKITCTCAY